jgi:hypothetical protein
VLVWGHHPGIDSTVSRGGMIARRHGIEMDMEALDEICKRYHVRELSSSLGSSSYAVPAQICNLICALACICSLPCAPYTGNRLVRA